MRNTSPVHVKKDLDMAPEGKLTNGEIPTAAQSVQRFFLNHPTIKYVRFQWTNMQGQLLARVATKAFALKLATQNKPIEVPSPICCASTNAGVLLFELLNITNDQVWAQWETLQDTIYAPAHAVVMCHVKIVPNEKVTHGFEWDPRSTLQRKLADVKERRGLEFLVGHEIEFLLLEKNPQTGKEEPASSVGMLWSTTSLRNKCNAVLEEIVDTLTDAGVEVRQYHSEGGAGLYEISTEPLPPLEAVDALYFTQETVKSIAYKHGMRATLAPQPFEGGQHIGCHTHLSIRETTGDKMVEAESFAAGLLNSLPGLCAIGMPSWSSFSRSDFLTGWVAYGVDFKMAPIRRVSPLEDCHWELRFPDTISNHYWLMTAVLGVGTAAIESDMKMTIKARTKMSEFPKEEREELGVTTKLPATYRQAIEALEADELIKKELGPELFERYVYLLGKDEEAFKKMKTEVDRRAALETF